MPTLPGMAQVWFIFLFIVMVVGAALSEGNDRRNAALVAVIAVFGLAGAIRRQRR
jgi:uncharacterized membrane protein